MSERDILSTAFLGRRMSRRQLLKRGAMAGGIGLSLPALLEACGTNSGSTSASGTPGNFKNTTLNIFSGGYTIDYEKLADTTWKNNNGGSINITNVPFGDRPAKLAGLIASHDASYDVVYTYDSYMQRFGDRLLLDLKDVIPQSARSDFLPITMQTMTAPSGVLKAGPMHAEHMVLLWNSDLFQKAGFSAAPKTWTEAYAMAPKFKSMGIIPMALPWLTPTYGDFYWTFFINSLFSGPILSHDKTQINFDNDKGLKSFQTIKAGIDAGFFDPGSYTATDEYAVALLYNSGKMAMHLGWTEHYKDAISQDVKNYQATISPSVVEAALIPAIEGGQSASTNGVEGLGINKYSNNIEAAKSFIQALTAPETVKAGVLSSTIYPPTRFSVLNDAEVISHFKIAKVWGDQAKYNLDRHGAPYDLAPIIDKSIANLIHGTWTPEQAQAEAVKGAKAAIQKWLTS